jgi:acrylyl-CoA reductase (NADPH)
MGLFYAQKPMNTPFRALQVAEVQPGIFSADIVQRLLSDLPAGEVLIRVQYSGLNYKDALAAAGNKGVVRQFPMTPGIDAAGEIVSSSDPNLLPGQLVLVTGYSLGMQTDGGLAQYIRVPAGWVVPMPEGLSAQESMIWGTAGLTAGQCIAALEGYGLHPGDGPVAVTGATGAVGSAAVAILAHLGYEVTAISGKPEAQKFLEKLGAHTVVGREALADTSGKPLLKATYAGGIDTVGGSMLGNLLKSLKIRGAVACCGLVASPVFEGSVFPFILRGNALFGIDSAECPMTTRLAIWSRLGTTWKPASLAALATQQLTLDEVPQQLKAMLEGKALGRTVVTMH